MSFCAAMQTLGIPADNTLVFGYPVRRLSYYRQELLEDLVKAAHSESIPDMVFSPPPAICIRITKYSTQKVLRCFKDMTIWGYELPLEQDWVSQRKRSSLLEALLICRLSGKRLQAYKSQFELGRPYSPGSSSKVWRAFAECR